jgi:hypothetical protein
MPCQGAIPPNGKRRTVHGQFGVPPQGNAESAGRVREGHRVPPPAGGTGTPAFFVTGRVISGAQPLDQFVRLIEDELAR